MQSVRPIQPAGGRLFNKAIHGSNVSSSIGDPTWKSFGKTFLKSNDLRDPKQKGQPHDGWLVNLTRHSPADVDGSSKGREASRARDEAQVLNF